eukprot:4623579-Prymnesium_polylepis.1
MPRHHQEFPQLQSFLPPSRRADAQRPCARAPPPHHRHRRAVLPSGRHGAAEATCRPGAARQLAGERLHREGQGTRRVSENARRLQGAHELGRRRVAGVLLADRPARDIGAAR